MDVPAWNDMSRVLVVWLIPRVESDVVFGSKHLASAKATSTHDLAKTTTLAAGLFTPIVADDTNGNPVARARTTIEITSASTVQTTLPLFVLYVIGLDDEEGGEDSNRTAAKRSHDRVNLGKLGWQTDGLDEFEVGRSTDTYLELDHRGNKATEENNGDHTCPVGRTV